MRIKTLLTLLAVSIICFILVLQENVSQPSSMSKATDSSKEENAIVKVPKAIVPNTNVPQFFPTPIRLPESSACSIKLIDVPNVPFEDVDRQASREIAKDPYCVDSEYNRLFIFQNRLEAAWINDTRRVKSQDPLYLLLKENYDAAIFIAYQNLKGYESIAVEDRYTSAFSINHTRVVDYRHNLHIIALANEFKGDYESASLVRKLLYSPSDRESQCFSLRLRYAQHMDRMKQKAEDAKENEYYPTSSYDDICNYATSQKNEIPLDDLLKASDENNDANQKPTRPSLRNAYRIRNEFAKIVNPRLHFCGLEPNEVTVMTRKSYALFLEFMESQYESKKQQEKTNRDDEEVMDFLRTISQLPN